MPGFSKPKPIVSQKVLLVEGNDEVNFLGEVLKHLGFRIDMDIQIREVGGKYKFRNDFPAFLKDPNFRQVTAYAIVRDADDNAEATLDSIQGLLRDNGQPCPGKHGDFASDGQLKVGVFIMPGNPNGSMLEDLCLQSVQYHPVMPYVETFMSSLRANQNVVFPRNVSKAKLQAFLSGMPETVCSVGMAAQKGYWSFKDPTFLSLQNFLKNLTV